MRVLALLVVASCTISGGGPAPVTARPPPDSTRMPSALLDHQDPGADTSNHPELSRTEAHRNGQAEGLRRLLGCMKMFSCSTSRRDGNDVGGLLVVAAALAVTRRRKSRSRNRS